MKNLKKLGHIKQLIKDSMFEIENLPVGGLGKDGPNQAELDKATNQGHPIGDDANYHAGQQIWLNLNEAMQELDSL